MGRQIEALVWIEHLLATDPVTEDLVSAWFDPIVANRLVLADIPTIGALLDRIRRKMCIRDRPQYSAEQRWKMRTRNKSPNYTTRISDPILVKA